MFEPRKPLKCFAGRTRDVKLLAESSSGGAFSELARVVLSDGGVVFGAAWEKDSFRVVHKWVDRESELSELRGTKYATSDLTCVYSDIRRFLDSGRKVLFTGTPCQVAAIGKFFGSQPSLILCSLFCMANVDISVWLNYVECLQKQPGSKLVRVEHKHKSQKSTRFFFVAEFEDINKNICVPLYSSEYWALFRQNPKQCCRSCAFKGGRHNADLMIGDFWKLENCMPELNWGNGSSAILVYSSKGESFLNRTCLDLHEVAYEQILSGNPYLEKSYEPNLNTKIGLCMKLRRKMGQLLRTLKLYND